jgi:hypothetical protein
MKDISVSMALVDYIPVLCFGAAIILLQSDLHRKMSKIAFALFATGTLNVTIAGFLKATYKLLYALGACDFEALNAMFFPTQSFGFLLAGVGLILFWVQKREEKLLAVAPPLFTGTFVFVGLMVAGLGMMDVVLCLIAAKLKKKGVIALFVLSFVCSLGMGYLSSQDFAKASMNWIAEGVNVVGQGTLLAGVWILHKNGLKDIR